MNLTRRKLLGVGAVVLGAAAVAPYVPLAVGGEFEQLVASTLGIEEELASQLLEAVRENYGSVEYEARAAAFSLAVRAPASAVLPEGMKESAVRQFLEPMFEEPAAALAYAVGGRDPRTRACNGLVRPA
jgi:hypothetical protein